MTTSRDANEFESDPLLDSLLDEVLGDRNPPDLRDQILRRLKKHSLDLQAAEAVAPGDSSASPPTCHDPKPSRIHESAADGTQSPASIAPLVTHHSAGERLQRAAAASRYFPVWMAASLASVLVLVGLLWGLLNSGSGLQNTGPVAQDASSGIADSELPPPVPANNIDPADESAVGPVENQPDADSGSTSASQNVEAADEQNDLEQSTEPPARQGEPASSSESVVPASDKPASETAPTRPIRLPRQQVLAQLNSRLREIWDQANVVPAPALPDDAWIGRVCQELLGRQPHVGELRTYMNWPASERRERFMDLVLGPDYGPQLSKHWSKGWASMLLENASSRPESLRVYQTGLEQFLAEAITQNDRYDQLVVRLLSASGSNEPSRADYDPAADYLLALEDGEGSQIFNELCRGFLSRRAQCAQCHDDTAGDFTQESYWQLASVFNSLDSEMLRVGRGRLVDQQTPSTVRYRDSNGVWKSTQPSDFAGNELGSEPGVEARRQFAEQLVQSPQFARAGVNRVWALFLQYGFTFPVDDMGDHNPVAHPELVDFLAQQFTAHQFDLRELSRWILLSEAFNRSDVLTAGIRGDFPENGDEPLFSRAYRRPVLFSEAETGLAWLSTGRIPQVISSDGEWDRQMLNARRNHDLNGEDVSGLTNEDGTIMRMGHLLSIRQVRMIHALTSSSMEQDQQIKHVYQMVLDRNPSGKEMEQARTVYEHTNNDAEIALQRIVWALINSREVW